MNKEHANRYLTFTPSLLVNYEPIDTQHKKWVDLFNELYRVFLDKGLTKEVKDVINEFIDYSVWHLDFENRMMEKYNYSNYKEHKEQHTNILKEIYVIQDKINNGEKVNGREVLEFLKEWLLKHIMHTDMKLGKYLSEIKAEPVRCW